MCSSMGIFPVFRYVNMRYEYAKIHLRCVSFRSMQQFLTLSRRMSMFSLLFPLTGRRSQEEKMEKYTNRSLLRGFVYFSYFARARWTALRASSNSDFCVCDTRKGIYAINTTVTALGSTIKIVIFFSSIFFSFYSQSIHIMLDDRNVHTANHNSLKIPTRTRIYLLCYE